MSVVSKNPRIGITYFIDGILNRQLVQEVLLEQFAGTCYAADWQTNDVLSNIPVSCTFQPRLQLHSRNTI